MRSEWRRLVPAVLAVALTATIVVGFVTGTAPAPDPVERIATQLRCPVCQSESVADSTSTTARRMRDQIAEFVQEGRSDEEIFAYYEARYGRWIRLAPPLTSDTLLLWSTPVVVLLTAVGLIVRRRRRGGSPRPVTARDRDRDRLRREIARLRHDESDA